MRRGAVILLAAALLWMLMAGRAKASESSGGAEAQYDYSGAQEALDEAMDEAPSFSGLVEDFMAGRAKEALGQLPRYLKDSLFSEIAAAGNSLGQLLAVAAVGALFSGLASAFQNRQTGETGFYVTYLLHIALELPAFHAAASVAEEAVSRAMGFMAALLPAFTLSMAAAGKTMTSVFSYEFVMAAISVCQWMFGNLFLPGIRVYVVLALVGHITKEEILTKLTELLELLLGWGLKALAGFVVGIGAVQSLVLPMADSLKTGAVTKLLGAIPGIGGGAGAAASLAAGTASLIKNSIGAAALVALLLLGAVPVLKLLVITLLHHGAAALLQPAADERVTECLSGVAGGTRLLLRVTAVSVGMMLLTVGLLCASTSIQL